MLVGVEVQHPCTTPFGLRSTFLGVVQRGDDGAGQILRVAAGEQTANGAVDHFRKGRLVHRHDRGAAGKGFQGDEPLTLVIGRVNHQIGGTEVLRQVIKRHPRLNGDGVADTQAFGLSHQGAAHVPSSNDHQLGVGVRLEHGRHGPQQGSVSLASHQSAHGQQQGRFGSRQTGQGRFVVGAVLLSQCLVCELVLFVVVVHRPKHLVVHTVQHGLAPPILGRLVPSLKF